MICALCLITLQLQEKKKKSVHGQQEILRSRTESHSDDASFCVNLNFTPGATKGERTLPSFLVPIGGIKLYREKTFLA